MYSNLIGSPNLGPRDDTRANCLCRVSDNIDSARHGFSDGTKRTPTDTFFSLLRSRRPLNLTISVGSSRVLFLIRVRLFVARVVVNSRAALERLALFGTRLVLICEKKTLFDRNSMLNPVLDWKIPQDSMGQVDLIWPDHISPGSEAGSWSGRGYLISDSCVLWEYFNQERNNNVILSFQHDGW